MTGAEIASNEREPTRKEIEKIILWEYIIELEKRLEEQTVATGQAFYSHAKRLEKLEKIHDPEVMSVKLSHSSGGK